MTDRAAAMPRLFERDRLDVWYDGAAIAVIAVGTHGDPLDLSESDVETLIAKLQAALAQARSRARAGAEKYRSRWHRHLTP